MSPDLKKNFYRALALTFLMSLLELIGLFSFIPFLLVLFGEIDVHLLVETYAELLLPILVQMTNSVGGIEILLFYSVIFLSAVSLCFRVISAYIMNSFTEKVREKMTLDFCLAILNLNLGELNQDKYNSVNTETISEIDTIVQQGVKPLFLSVVSGYLSAVIIGFGILIGGLDWFVLMCCFGLFYITVSYSINRNLRKLGAIRTQQNVERYVVLKTYFSALKEMIGYSQQKPVYNSFKAAVKRYSFSQQRYSTFMQSGTYFVDFLVITGGAAVAFFALRTPYMDFVKDPMVLSTTLISVYRLKPGFSNIYQGISALSYTKDSIDRLSNLSHSETKITFEDPIGTDHNNLLQINQLTIEEGWLYHNSKFKLKVPKLNFQRGDHTVITGPSGSGKTTFVDMICGFYSLRNDTIRLSLCPYRGRKALEIQPPGTRHFIAYVAQSVNILPSDSKLFNAKLTSAPDDFWSVIDALSLDRDLVSSLLRDVRIGTKNTELLSGGQLQRFGIARAIFSNRPILVFDEPTSALDEELALRIVKYITSKYSDRIIFWISHDEKQTRYFNKRLSIDEQKLVYHEKQF